MSDAWSRAAVWEPAAAVLFSNRETLSRETKHDALVMISCTQSDSQMSVLCKHIKILCQQVTFSIYHWWAIQDVCTAWQNPWCHIWCDVLFHLSWSYCVLLNVLFCAHVKGCTWLEPRVPGVCRGLLESVAAVLSVMFHMMIFLPEDITLKYRRWGNSLVHLVVIAGSSNATLRQKVLLLLWRYSDLHCEQWWGDGAPPRR